jgi:hypothetical protein
MKDHNKRSHLVWDCNDRTDDGRRTDFEGKEFVEWHCVGFG